MALTPSHITIAFSEPDIVVYDGNQLNDPTIAQQYNEYVDETQPMISDNTTVMAPNDTISKLSSAHTDNISVIAPNDAVSYDDANSHDELTHDDEIITSVSDQCTRLYDMLTRHRKQNAQIIEIIQQISYNDMNTWRDAEWGVMICIAMAYQNSDNVIMAILDKTSTKQLNTSHGHWGYPVCVAMAYHNSDNVIMAILDKTSTKQLNTPCGYWGYPVCVAIAYHCFTNVINCIIDRMDPAILATTPIPNIGSRYKSVIDVAHAYQTPASIIERISSLI